MSERRLPTREEVMSYLTDRNNWGRWGPDDERGAMNLITDEKRVAASRLVRTGRTVSMSRYWKTGGVAGNLYPAQHYMKASYRHNEGDRGSASDFLGAFYHGRAFTHIDALCHVWGADGMWNGRDPKEELTFDGSKWGGIDVWSDGVITRGVLLDIPKLRGVPYVTEDKPVHGWDLEDAAKAQGIAIQPGDVVAVYSGREKWQADHPDVTYGTQEILDDLVRISKPGLHASCLPFIRDNDISALAWDMMDAYPDGYDFPNPVHCAIYAYGISLLDNCLLQPLAEACQEEGRYEFMLVVSPLKVQGATGSPANPLAVF